MSAPVAHYNAVYERACEIFVDKSFVYASLAIELKLRNADLHTALDALVADGMLKIISERPTLFAVTKFTKE